MKMLLGIPEFRMALGVVVGYVGSLFLYHIMKRRKRNV